MWAWTTGSDFTAAAPTKNSPFFRRCRYGSVDNPMPAFLSRPTCFIISRRRERISRSVMAVEAVEFFVVEPLIWSSVRVRGVGSHPDSRCHDLADCGHLSRLIPAGAEKPAALADWSVSPVTGTKEWRSADQPSRSLVMA